MSVSSRVAECLDYLESVFTQPGLHGSVGGYVLKAVIRCSDVTQSHFLHFRTLEDVGVDVRKLCNDSQLAVLTSPSLR